MSQKRIIKINKYSGITHAKEFSNSQENNSKSEESLQYGKKANKEMNSNVSCTFFQALASGIKKENKLTHSKIWFSELSGCPKKTI